MATPKACVSCFSICDDARCTLMTGVQHLLVKTVLVDLVRGNATALSYIWGSFDRSVKSIGHTPSGELVKLKLGAEWELADVIAALAHLSRPLDGRDVQHPLWLDQISIVQASSDTIRDTLAQIPDIFRTFEVVALMPEGRCQCQMDQISLITDHTEEEFLADASLAVRLQNGLTKSDSCPNNISFASYFQRIWTRQEMLYATSWRIYWISGVLPCQRMALSRTSAETPKDTSRTTKAVERLCKAAKLQLKGLLSGQLDSSSQRDQDYALNQLETVTVQGMEALRQTFFMWLQLNTSFIISQAGDRQREIFRVLGGKILVAVMKPSKLTDLEKLYQFSASLFNLRRNERKATKARDYVLAIWVDCPRYTVPEDYRSMTATKLLENAVLQLEDKHSMTLHSTVPAGLFSSGPGSALFRPTRYFEDQGFESTMKVYAGACLDALTIPLNIHRTIAVISNPKKQDSYAKDIRLFGEYTADMPSSQVFTLVAGVADTWNTNVIKTIRDIGLTLEANTPRWTDMDYRILLDAVTSYTNMTMTIRNHREVLQREVDEEQKASLLETLGKRRTTLWDEKEIEHGPLIHRLACDAMGLQARTATEHGLQLVIEKGSEAVPPRLGFFRRGFDLQTKTFTIHTGFDPIFTEEGKSPEFYTGMNYEVIKSGMLEDRPTFEVVGTWVPHMSTTSSYIDGYVYSTGKAGYIV